jgi:hypothetical protein
MFTTNQHHRTRVRTNSSLLQLSSTTGVTRCLPCCQRADKARPHWGKSWSRVYTQTACPIRSLHPGFNTQLALQRQYDPTRMFETQMLTAVIARGAANPGGPARTNEMNCYCKDDRECGAAGLCCRTAPAGLPPYRVCLAC